MPLFPGPPERPDRRESAPTAHWPGLLLFGDATLFQLPELGQGWWWTIGALVLACSLLIWRLLRMGRRS
jgi:hypothetical protein